MNRNKTARTKDFAISPRGDIERSIHRMPQTRKMGFNASELVPVMVEEVLPGDTWQHHEAISARLATPIVPVLDDMYLETFYFFVPNRITWDNDRWEDFITGTDVALTIPTIYPVEFGVGYKILTGSVFDHMGLLPQTYGTSVFKVNVLPIWAYFTIWNEWFRDQNLQAEWIWSATWTTGTSDLITQNGTAWNQRCLRANKPHDYITSSLPFAQKGNPVTIPLGTTAPVFTTSTTGQSFRVGNQAGAMTDSRQIDTSGAIGVVTALTGAANNLFADLSTATAATLNSLRMAITTQQLLEKDARGGSRYIEQLLVHFGARSPDYRMQRPEYLGGSRTMVTVNPIAQTASYDAQPDDDPSAIGNLGAEMHVNSVNKSFTYAATEHGYIIGVAVCRATPTYQQGTRKHWNRSTRLDYPFPTFAHLGEQAIMTTELYQPANNAPANAIWGYQGRYDEMRFIPNEITGVLRSTSATPMDWWHYAEKFGSEPALNDSFIQDKTYEVLGRSLATAPSAQWACQIIMDIKHTNVVARMLPSFGVPGLTRF